MFVLPQLWSPATLSGPCMECAQFLWKEKGDGLAGKLQLKNEESWGPLFPSSWLACLLGSAKVSQFVKELR